MIMLPLLLLLMTQTAVRSAQSGSCSRSCMCHKDQMDCSNGDLTQLDDISQSRNITSLDISRNGFQEVPSVIAASMPALRKLDLSHNRISQVNRWDFNGTRLTFLSLAWNQLNTLGDRKLAGLSSVKQLDLSGNRLNELHEQVTRELSQLEELLLDRNLFTVVPSRALTPLANLRALGLGGNQLKTVAANAFNSLNNLIVLDLKNNYLKQIDIEAFAGLGKLNALELEGNLLTDVPRAIRRLTSIQSIKLSGNRLPDIRDGVLQTAPSLERLELRGNPISTAGVHSFSNMPRLKELELLGVKAMSVMPDLNGTGQLRDLRIYGSRVTRLPDDLCQVMSGLKRLYMPSNQLQLLPVLEGCSELRLVDLSYNNLVTLGERAFRSQRHLQDLLLRNNGITKLADNVFEGLSQLQVLDLRYNRISMIGERAFESLRVLQRLNLNDNQFARLPASGLQSVRHLHCANIRQLSEFPSPRLLPALRVVHVPYAYHCCQFRPRSSATAITDAATSTDTVPVVTVAEADLSEKVIFATDAPLNMSLWHNNLDDVWPEFGNLSANFGSLGQELLSQFDEAYPTGVPAYLQDPAAVQVVLNTNIQPMFAGQVMCSPAPTPFMPCEDLFDWWTLRCGVWLVFLLALLGNGTVVFVLVFARTKLDVPRFLVCNLAAADFFMGVYLGFLAVVDASTLGQFRQYAISWQMSAGCQLAGFLGVFSCELSVFTLTVITMERNYAITHAMHLNKRLSLRHATYIMVGGWAFALCMATLPLVGVSDYRRFAVCLPFETAGAGAGYVVFLMLANGAAFTILMACYCKMYCAIRGSQAWNSNDSRIAKRMALLVFTDFLCWAPIALLALTAAFGVHLTSLEGAKVFTVFVLPFNSCCNPFLYAILTKQFKKDCVLICKAIEESRVTRGIGRGRHSSNFSNRHTPANTNSLAERTSKESGAAAAAAAPAAGAGAGMCSCANRGAAQLLRPESNGDHATVQIRRHGGVWRALMARCSPTAKYSRRQHKLDETHTCQIAEIQRGRHVGNQRQTSVSSDNFSTSRDDSLRRHRHQHRRQHSNGAAMHDAAARRRRNSWSVTRKPSQESNMSTSRNDSSATAGSNTTQSWQLSRSSVSSDVGQHQPTPPTPPPGVNADSTHTMLPQPKHVTYSEKGVSDEATEGALPRENYVTRSLHKHFSRGILKKQHRPLIRQVALTDEVTPRSTSNQHHCPYRLANSCGSGDFSAQTTKPRPHAPVCRTASLRTVPTTIVEATVERASPPLSPSLRPSPTMAITEETQFLSAINNTSKTNDQSICLAMQELQVSLLDSEAKRSACDISRRRSSEDVSSASRQMVQTHRSSVSLLARYESDSGTVDPVQHWLSTASNVDDGGVGDNIQSSIGEQNVHHSTEHLRHYSHSQRPSQRNHTQRFQRHSSDSAEALPLLDQNQTSSIREDKL